jgi:hypothetical protein
LRDTPQKQIPFGNDKSESVIYKSESAIHWFVIPNYWFVIPEGDLLLYFEIALCKPERRTMSLESVVKIRSDIVLLILLLFGHGLIQAETKSPARMSVSEAKQFALAATPHKSKQLPGFQLELDNSAYEGLYVFNAIWEGLPGGSVESGFYAVDPITGTVWDSVMECDQLSTPRLRELQKRWIKHSGLTKTQLFKFQAPGPQCPSK